jgi:uncharacterized protein (DUF1800 family)
MANQDVALMAHLMRRAGFGAARQELDEYVARGYETVVEELLDPGDSGRMPDDVIRRYHNEQSGMMGQVAPASYWLYRMISTETPLQDKIALFWHNVFATGYPKVTQGKVLSDQIRMFGRYGMGSLKTLLIELCRDPAMIAWLDNNDNHNGAINENFGRELLELFSMGVGNYSEQDIKECARAFTGWNIGNNEYMELRARRDSIWPYGRIAWHFQYNADDHDDGEKEFLGRTGRFNGEDIINIICEQPATARFIARHMYHFFVADEPPVPQWPYTPPRDPAAIETLSNTYFESNYDIASMLRVLFNSDFFRSEASWYEKVKSPAEVVAGVLRLSGEFRKPGRAIRDRSDQMTYMGQQLTNPPSVEGWHQGTEWIDTGTLVERLNFASGQLSDAGNPGSHAIMERIVERTGGTLSPEGLVDSCLDEVGALSVSEETRCALVEFASVETEEGPTARVARLLQLVVATPEFQRS